MSRVIIVSANSPLLSHGSTQQLHTYENGDCLIRTEAPQPESGQWSETSVSQGLSLIQPETALTGEAELTQSEEAFNAYIELIGPVDSRWLNQLTELGLELLQYQPHHCYLCRGKRTDFEQARRQPFVLNIIPLQHALKPSAIVLEGGNTEVFIVLQGELSDAASLLKELNTISGVEINPNQEIDAINFYLRIRAEVSAIGQTKLLAHPLVLAVEPYHAPELEDEVASLIVAGQYDATGQPKGSYLQWLDNRGVNGSGVTIGIVDAGVNPNHPAFGNRVKDLTYGKQSWHGTFVAGHAAGCYLEERDDNQFIYGLGIAPKANLLIQDNQRPPTVLCQETVSKGVSGVVGSIQNNSWGMGIANPMNYGSLEATYDQLVRNANPTAPGSHPLTICFSSGNSGAAGLTRPKAAKNLIVTGNSETFRPEIGGDQSDNINEVYTGPRGSSHGNCGDGRIVPHVVAPGEWTASANFGARPGTREYISPQLTWGGGSSGASPKTAGACALLTQWWQRLNHQTKPSPAMLKALIVNGAEPIISGGPIPNPIQGWGRLNLDSILDEAVQRIYVDQTQRLTQRGEEQTWSLRVADPRKPVKITLCWTEPPGNIGSGTEHVPAIVNKLALRMQTPQQLYRANQFSNGWSYSGGTAFREGWDNLQNIFITPGSIQGSFQVTVTALELTTNCLTGKVFPPQQDFALVMTNVIWDHQTPVNVFVATDDVSTSSPPQDDSFWSPEDSDEDTQDLDSEWWHSIYGTTDSSGNSAAQNTGPAGISSATGNSSAQQHSTAAKLWWLQDNPWWITAETKPVPLEETVSAPNLLPAIITAAMDEHHSIFMANGRTLEGSRNNSPGLLEIQPDTNLAPDVLPSLTSSLEQLMSHWQHLGHQRRAAVLVVRSHTRFRRADLATMRQLAFWGDLYLVSDSPQVLAFLSQRITSPNLYLRFAPSAQLSHQLYSSLLESNGGQVVRVDTMRETTFTGELCHNLFQIVPADERFTIHIHAEALSGMKLLGPDGAIVPLEQKQSPQFSHRQGDGFIQLTFEAKAQMSWAGQWRLMLQYDEQRPTPVAGHEFNTVQVWTWGRLQWQVQHQFTDISEEPDSLHSLLIRVNAPDACLKRLWCPGYRILSAEENRPQHQKGFDVNVELASVSDAEVAVSSTQQAIAKTASTLSATLTLAPFRTAVSLEFPLWIEGESEGYRFTRRIQCSLVQRLLRSTWREQITPTGAPIFTPARIVDVQTQENAVVALTLTHQHHVRTVQIRSAQLQAHLYHAFENRFPDQELIVGVIGNELCGIYCPLHHFPVARQLPFSLEEL